MNKKLLIGAACSVLVVAALIGLYAVSRPSPPLVLPSPLGAIRSDMTDDESAAFRDALEPFVVPHPAHGPYYFGATCAECHSHPTLGGSSDLRTAAHLGPGPNGGVGYHTHALPGWTITPRPGNASRRVAPPLYGLALVEKIPDETIRTACSKGTGRFEPAKRLGSSPPNDVARFGYKSYLGTLPDFIGDVLRGAMGVTSSVESTTDEDDFPDPEVDREYVESLAAFVRGLAPPTRDGTDAEGEAVFHELGCASCHVPDMLPAKSVYSDFCLHRMGEGLAEEGVRDRGILPDEFRTQPLWGIRLRTVLLHDGRATTFDEAIVAHGGEAESAVAAYKSAPAERRAALHRFLGTL